MEDLESPPTEDELCVNTWRDASLYELSMHIKEVNTSARKLGARLAFRLVTQDRVSGLLQSRDVGVLSGSRPGREDNLTLDALRFSSGDFFSVAILRPGERLERPAQPHIGDRVGDSRDGHFDDRHHREPNGRERPFGDSHDRGRTFERRPDDAFGDRRHGFNHDGRREERSPWGERHQMQNHGGEISPVQRDSNGRGLSRPELNPKGGQQDRSPDRGQGGGWE